MVMDGFNLQLYLGITGRVPLLAPRLFSSTGTGITCHLTVLALRRINAPSGHRWLPTRPCWIIPNQATMFTGR